MIIELANDKIKEVWGRGNDIEGLTAWYYART
jgi:hypothetical protein